MINKTFTLAVLTALFLAAGTAVPAHAQLNLDYHHPVLEDYFAPAAATPATPDSKGFIRRWSLLEPIAKPEIRSNAVFDDDYLNAEFAKVYFDGQNEIVPKDGQTVKLDKKTKLAWHCYDSKRYNVKLYRFATGLGLHPTEALYLAVTVVNAPEDMTVRMAVGSNSGSKWWVNGEEAILLTGDRRMVVDDCVSKKITLKAGRNVIRGAVINGPGMSDFCIRFLGEDGRPVTNLTVTNQ
ncbi:MAG: acetylxylan esterase [Bacteroidales bacterium]|nr:acetylxylan esterase [Bacteroidales bacterium]